MSNVSHKMTNSTYNTVVSAPRQLTPCALEKSYLYHTSYPHNYPVEPGWAYPRGAVYLYLRTDIIRAKPKYLNLWRLSPGYISNRFGTSSPLIYFVIKNNNNKRDMAEACNRTFIIIIIIIVERRSDATLVPPKQTPARTADMPSQDA